MANNIRIQDLGFLYAQGLKQFIEGFLKEKAESGESLVYSIYGRIIELDASDVLWLYTKLSEGPEPWEIDLLQGLAKEGKDIVYNFSNEQTLKVPAAAVLDFLDNIKKLKADERE
ncbi:MAG: hypothetical protein IKX59_11785 [Bacteroidales bacterium]|nr:hypothetical protein [Bacteroidales bacterium]